MNYTAKGFNEYHYSTYRGNHVVKKINCCLCGDNVSEMMSHNARPVKEGRCCYQCNAEVVVPTRMGMIVMDINIGDEEKEEQ